MERDSGAAVYEFFAGGGMARVGLGAAWRIAFANDFSQAKVRHYRDAFQDGAVRLADVWDLEAEALPGQAALAWASFPCQDISLAGQRAGLDAPRSGSFWGFWRLIEGLLAQGRAPRILVLENVTGLLTSNKGKDFAALATALVGAGYRFGALEIDAAAFVPQSRPRLFVVAVQEPPPPALAAALPDGPFHTDGVIAAVEKLGPKLRRSHLWWALPAPALRNTTLADLLEDPPRGACWNTAEKTDRLLAMMSERQRARVAELQGQRGRHVGALFRRIRTEGGAKVQRAEARFDGLAGCLRTPAGGSSRQTLVVIEDGVVRTRLISPREAARLMGLPDEYPLPARQSAALHLLGDGVAAPVVRWLSHHLLEPLAASSARRAA